MGESYSLGYGGDVYSSRIRVINFIGWIMKIHNIEQRSPEWLQLKLGKIGGTRLKAVMSSNNLPLIYELLAEDGAAEVEESYKSPAMQWGIDMEEFALAIWEGENNRQLVSHGWIESEFSEIVGISPDGLTRDCVKGVEIKCPTTKKHVEYIISGRIPSEYKPQILHYFLVIDTLRSLDFVSYDPRFIKKPFHCVTVTRDELSNELIDAKESLNKFLNKLEKYRAKI